MDLNPGSSHPQFWALPIDRLSIFTQHTLTNVFDEWWNKSNNRHRYGSTLSKTCGHQHSCQTKTFDDFFSRCNIHRDSPGTMFVGIFGETKPKALPNFFRGPVFRSRRCLAPTLGATSSAVVYFKLKNTLTKKNFRDSWSQTPHSAPRSRCRCRCRCRRHRRHRYFVF